MDKKTCPQCGNTISGPSVRCPRCNKLLLSPCCGNCSQCQRKTACS